MTRGLYQSIRIARTMESTATQDSNTSSLRTTVTGERTVNTRWLCLYGDRKKQDIVTRCHLVISDHLANSSQAMMSWGGAAINTLRAQ